MLLVTVYKDVQTPSIPCDIVAKYDAPHTRLPRATLTHEKDLFLFGFLDLVPDVVGHAQAGRRCFEVGHIVRTCLSYVSIDWI